MVQLSEELRPSLQERVHDWLKAKGGLDDLLEDLPNFIVTLVGNNRPKTTIINELTPFLETTTTTFVEWLLKEVEALANPEFPRATEAVANEDLLETGFEFDDEDEDQLQLGEKDAPAARNHGSQRERSRERTRSAAREHSPYASSSRAHRSRGRRHSRSPTSSSSSSSSSSLSPSRSPSPASQDRRRFRGRRGVDSGRYDRHGDRWRLDRMDRYDRYDRRHDRPDRFSSERMMSQRRDPYWDSTRGRRQGGPSPPHRRRDRSPVRSRNANASDDARAGRRAVKGRGSVHAPDPRDLRRTMHSQSAVASDRHDGDDGDDGDVASIGAVRSRRGAMDRGQVGGAMRMLQAATKQANADAAKNGAQEAPSTATATEAVQSAAVSSHGAPAPASSSNIADAYQFVFGAAEGTNTMSQALAEGGANRTVDVADLVKKEPEKAAMLLTKILSQQQQQPQQEQAQGLAVPRASVFSRLSKGSGPTTTANGSTRSVFSRLGPKRQTVAGKGRRTQPKAGQMMYRPPAATQRLTVQQKQKLEQQKQLALQAQMNLQQHKRQQQQDKLMAMVAQHAQGKKTTTTAAAPLTSPASTAPKAQSKMPAQGHALPINEVPCRYFPHCKNKKCPFFHPVKCRFNLACKRRATCPFWHGETSKAAMAKGTPATGSEEGVSDRKFAVEEAAESMVLPREPAANKKHDGHKH